jgi:hypothetical protein
MIKRHDIIFEQIRNIADKINDYRGATYYMYVYGCIEHVGDTINEIDVQCNNVICPIHKNNSQWFQLNIIDKLKTLLLCLSYINISIPKPLIRLIITYLK